MNEFIKITMISPGCDERKAYMTPKGIMVGEFITAFNYPRASQGVSFWDQYEILVNGIHVNPYQTKLRNNDHVCFQEKQVIPEVEESTETVNLYGQVTLIQPEKETTDDYVIVGQTYVIDFLEEHLQLKDYPDDFFSIYNVFVNGNEVCVFETELKNGDEVKVASISGTSLEEEITPELVDEEIAQGYEEPIPFEDEEDYEELIPWDLDEDNEEEEPEPEEEAELVPEELPVDQSCTIYVWGLVLEKFSFETIPNADDVVQKILSATDSLDTENYLYFLTDNAGNVFGSEDLINERNVHIKRELYETIRIMDVENSRFCTGKIYGEIKLSQVLEAEGFDSDCRVLLTRKSSGTWVENSVNIQADDYLMVYPKDYFIRVKIHSTINGSTGSLEIRKGQDLSNVARKLGFDEKRIRYHCNLESTNNLDENSVVFVHATLPELGIAVEHE